MRSIYCVLYDDEKKRFDVFGPISDDTMFTESVVKAQQKGLQVHCSTVMSSEVDSIESLIDEGALLGYKYHKGLMQELKIKVSVFL